MPLVRPEPLVLTREELVEQDQAMTEMETLWAQQAKERDMKQAEIEAAKGGRRSRRAGGARRHRARIGTGISRWLATKRSLGGSIPRGWDARRARVR